MEIQRRNASLSSKRLPTINTGRARIPEPANFDYAIRPPSTAERDEEEEEEKRGSRDKEEMGRREKMVKRLDRMRKSAASGSGRAKYKVDISGRGL